MMEAKELTEEDAKNFSSLLTFMKRLADGEVTPLIEKQLLLMLEQSLPFFGHLIMTDHFNEISRITINRRVTNGNKRISDIKLLKYPPASKVLNYGRCNMPQKSVLYASMIKMTAIKEIRPNVGDLITESTWRTKNNDSLIFSPIFRNQPLDKTFNMNTHNFNQAFIHQIRHHSPHIKKMITELTQFIADAFTREVHPKNHLDYIFSAYFSNKILYELGGGKIEALYYPSVKEKLAFENIAIKPEAFDKKYELVEITESVVMGAPQTGFDGLFMNVTGDCKKFDYAAEKILWDTSQVLQTKETLADLKWRFGVDLE